jgi:uncharacterized protein (DUF1015 family)
LEVTDPLEKSIGEMTTINNIQSSSYADLSLITVELLTTVPDDEVEQQWDMLRRKVANTQSKLPQGASASQVRDDFGDVYGMFYALKGDGQSDKVLNDYAELIKRSVNEIDGVSRVEIYGKRNQCVNIELREDKMANLGVMPTEIIMTLNNTWYRLVPHKDIYDPNDSISRLDVSILQEHLLGPILGIQDPRTDPRIVFIGGKDGIAHVETLASKPGCVGFLLYPTDIHDLLSVADDQRIMPPKSTWFEPKLLSGLLVHEF